MPNFVSVATSVAELAHGEKSRTQSIIHSHPVVGFGDRSTGRGTFGANLGRPIGGTLRRTCRLSQRRGPLPKLLWADLFYLQRHNQLVQSGS